MIEPEYSKKETRALLGGISERTLERRMKERLIGFYRDGARVSFGAHHIEAYRRAKEQKARRDR